MPFKKMYFISLFQKLNVQTGDSSLQSKIVSLDETSARVPRVLWGFGPCVDAIPLYKGDMLMNSGPFSCFHAYQTFYCVLFLSNTNNCPLHFPRPQSVVNHARFTYLEIFKITVIFI